MKARLFSGFFAPIDFDPDHLRAQTKRARALSLMLPEDDRDMPAHADVAPGKMSKPEPARSVVGGAVFKFSSLFTALGERQRELTEQIKRLTEELRQVEAAQKAAGTALTALSEDAALTDEERARALAPMEMSLVDSLGRFNEADI